MIAESCEWVVVLPTPLGGIVSCIVEGCDGKVTKHGMLRTARGLRLPMPGRLYWCDRHGPESTIVDAHP